MAKYVALLGIKDQALARFIANPEDRREPVRRLIEAAGGRLECYYWLFGQYDALVIFEAPDSATMASVILAATSTGAFSHCETHELIEADDLVSVLRRAQTLRASYRPPGQTPA